jgi:hypothetical protein
MQIEKMEMLIEMSFKTRTFSRPVCHVKIHPAGAKSFSLVDAICKALPTILVDFPSTPLLSSGLRRQHIAQSRCAKMIIPIRCFSCGKVNSSVACTARNSPISNSPLTPLSGCG